MLRRALLTATRVSTPVFARRLPIHTPTRAISQSLVSMKAEQDAKKELIEVLDREYAYEKDNSEPSTKMPSHLDSFMKESGFQLEAVEGSNEAKLTRQAGNEKITIAFNIVPDYQSMEDDGEEAADVSEQEEEDVVDQASLELTVDVTKADGTLTFFVSAVEDGDFVVNEVEFAPTTLAQNVSAESDFMRRTKYLGPRFGDLDEDLQDAFADYLEERGFTDGLNKFIHEYAQWKEQSEYIRWLEKVKSFLNQ